MGIKYTASVVGTGGAGKGSIHALVNSPRFKLVAIADLDSKVCAALQNELPGIKTFTNYRQMFSEYPTDVVCISTWPPSHEEIVLEALKLHLKGILVEKPLGYTFAAGSRILNAVKEKNIAMVVPHGLMVKKVPLEIICRVQRGEIGDLKLVEIQSTRWDIINAGIHWLNFFVNLVNNEPIDYVMAICESSTRTYRDKMQVETTGVTYIQTKKGIRVVMNTGDEVLVNMPDKKILFRIIGTAGQIEFWGFEDLYRIQNNEFPSGKLFTTKEVEITPHQRHLDNMAAMIDNGEVDYRIPETSLTALELCEAAYISSRHRCKVTFPLAQFTPPAETDWNPGMPYSGKGGGRDGRKL